MSDWDQFGDSYDHPHFKGQQRTYLLASSPRSGSHYLGHLLCETGELGSPLEYFHPEHLKKWKEKLNAGDEETAFRHILARRTSPSGWFGVKAHWKQFAIVRENERLQKLFSFEKYLLITRRDKVAQGISFALAQATQAWISFQKTKKAPTYSFVAIQQAVKQLEAQEARWKSYFAARDIDPIVVEYEDLTADPAAVVDKIRSSFGITSVSSSRESLKMPEKQGGEINDEWRQLYLQDLAAQGNG